MKIILKFGLIIFIFSSCVLIGYHKYDKNDVESGKFNSSFIIGIDHFIHYVILTENHNIFYEDDDYIYYGYLRRKNNTIDTLYLINRETLEKIMPLYKNIVINIKENIKNNITSQNYNIEENIFIKHFRILYFYNDDGEIDNIKYQIEILCYHHPSTVYLHEYNRFQMKFIFILDIELNILENYRIYSL
jgi:hypothetical protein